MINLTSLSEDYPTWIEEEKYEQLIQQKKHGWSHCETTLEWLSKLYYLRKGLKSGKITSQNFVQREHELVINWWLRWC